MNNNVGISLGNVCYSAVWGVNNNIRAKKENGYMTCPFDLIVSNYKGIVQCIYDDFADFCNPEYLNTERGPLCNIKYNFVFNHETPYHADLYKHQNWEEGPEHFINNNYKHFIIRYNNRINSFREYLNTPNINIIFLIQFVNEVKPDDDYNELRKALRLKYPNLKYTIHNIPSPIS